jgi:hypothetical protein
MIVNQVVTLKKVDIKSTWRDITLHEALRISELTDIVPHVVAH